MQTMQDKMLAEFSKLAANAGLEATRQGDWANTGRVFIQSGFDTVLTVAYSFQTGYCSLELSGPAVDAANLSDNPPAYRFKDGKLSYHHLEYHHSDRVKGMLALFGELVAHVPVAA